jgi:hypothetical protein
MARQIALPQGSSVATHRLGTEITFPNGRRVIVAEDAQAVTRALLANQPNAVGSVIGMSGPVGPRFSLVAPISAALPRSEGVPLYVEVAIEPSDDGLVAFDWKCGACGAVRSSTATIAMSNVSARTAAIVCTECNAESELNLVRAW